MGKKQNNNKTEEHNSRRKFWIGTGIAGLVLAAFGAFAVHYPGKPEAKETNQAVLCQETADYGIWKSAINREGIIISDSILDKYLDEEFHLKKTTPESRAEAVKRLEQQIDYFKDSCTPQNYTKKVFTVLVSTSMDDDKLIKPSKYCWFFVTPELNGLYEELLKDVSKNNDDPAHKLLNCAVLMTYKRLTRIAKSEDTVRDFEDNLKKGVGDCSDYTYAAANIYYKLCNVINRADLVPKIRIVQGFYMDKNNKMLGWHAWLQLNEIGKWKDIDLSNLDNIKPDTPISMSTPVLYGVLCKDDSKTIPVVSTQASIQNNELCITKYAHILPFENEK